MREAIAKRPEGLILVELDVGLLALADLFSFVLVLIAVAYSTWIVLPWAFYKKLEKRNAIKQLNWLRRAQILLFIAGVFFTFYVFADLAMGLSNLDPFASSLISLMRTALFVSGFAVLLGGLYDSFRVINFYSYATGARYSLLRWATVPFLFFNTAIIFGLGIDFGIGFHLAKQITLVGEAILASSFVAWAGTILAVVWHSHIGNLSRGFDIRGFVAIALVIFPYILLLALYLLGPSGGCLFQGGFMCPSP